jgi:flavin-dependent dehydrogenase
MARQGYQVFVCDRSSEANLGRRYDVIHIRQENFSRFGIPEPKPGDPDYVTVFHRSIHRSALDKWPKNHYSEVLVLRRGSLMRRLAGWAREQGAQILMETEFVSPVFDAQGRLSGGLFKGKHGEFQVKARLTADASGIGAAVRTALPKNYGVENFITGPRDQFYVVLRYVKLKNPDERVEYTQSWPFYKTWIAPQLKSDGAIYGVGANLSFDYANRCWEHFARRVSVPAHEFEYIEQSSTPYRRPPYSFAADGFAVLGDAACITNPMSGEGVSYGWLLCAITAEEFGRAMRDGAYPEREKVWPVNRRYAQAQGASFARILAVLPGAVTCTAEENDYEFEQGIIFEDDKEKGRGNLVLKLLKGLFLGKLSLGTLKKLAGAVAAGNRIYKHYMNFPEEPGGFEGWVKKAEVLWGKTLMIADLAEKDFAQMEGET